MRDLLRGYVEMYCCYISAVYDTSAVSSDLSSESHEDTRGIYLSNRFNAASFFTKCVDSAQISVVVQLLQGDLGPNLQAYSATA